MGNCTPYGQKNEKGEEIPLLALLFVTVNSTHGQQGSEQIGSSTFTLRQTCFLTQYGSIVQVFTGTWKQRSSATILHMVYGTMQHFSS